MKALIHHSLQTPICMTSWKSAQHFLPNYLDSIEMCVFFLNCRSDDKDISVGDLFLLCDLFYLPFEHGSRSLQIINEFYWLKTNASVLVSSYKKGQDISSAKPEVRLNSI